MAGVTALPLLIHPQTKTPMPWADTRMVPQQTMCEYLGADRGRWAALVKEGRFDGPGCTVKRGKSQSRACYIPAAIYAHNRWIPAIEVMSVLTAPTEAIERLITGTERLQAELRFALTQRRVAAP